MCYTEKSVTFYICLLVGSSQHIYVYLFSTLISNLLAFKTFERMLNPTQPYAWKTLTYPMRLPPMTLLMLYTYVYSILKMY